MASFSLSHLQSTYPRFIYDKYEYNLVGDVLEVAYHFVVGEHEFSPKLRFHGITAAHLEAIGKKRLEQSIFHLGLAEIPSYWKLTCSPTIEVKAGTLDDFQRDFWKKLIEKGLGEFFYVNDIFPFAPHIKVPEESKFQKNEDSLKLDSDKVLLPVGGGKDSAVSFELMRSTKRNITLFTLGEDAASREMIKVFNSGEVKYAHMQVDRILDPLLFDLNAQGYLNGHTPFSSVVAFTTLLTASLLGIGDIVLSNERSANEETGVYNGIDINHQYSKSYEFERDFRDYVEHTFKSAPNYFSLLRPLYEIQIMSLFARYQQYLPVFRSCNVGKKTNAWCGNCAKCVFVGLLLSAFLPPEQVALIFGKNILDDGSRLRVLDQLTGEASMKALECVGTRRETMAALYRVYKQYKESGAAMPQLLAVYRDRLEQRSSELDADFDHLLSSFDDDHFVPPSLVGVLKHALEV